MDIAKQVVVFCHFKGGVGNSFIASNVALELAKNKILTCLIDFDTKLPNCANILGLEIKKSLSLYKYFNNNNPDIRGNYFIADKAVSPYLYIISSSSEDEVELLEEMNDNTNDVEELLNLTKNVFDIVIVDLPVDYQEPQVIESIEKADKVFIVGDLDINTIENTFRSLEMYKSINIPLSKFSYITNKHFNNNDITIAVIQETLGVRLGPSIPLDYNAVFESIVRSKPIVNTKHKISNSIREICSTITGNITFDTQMVSDQESPRIPLFNSKEEVAPTKFTLISDEEEKITPTKFTLISDEEGEESNGNS